MEKGSDAEGILGYCLKPLPRKASGEGEQSGETPEPS